MNHLLTVNECMRIWERNKRCRPQIPAQNTIVALNTFLTLSGSACLKLDQYEEAISMLQKALGLLRIIFEEKPAASQVGFACLNLAKAFLYHQKHHEALSCFQEALEIFKVNHAEDNEAECVLGIARCYKNLKNFDLAVKMFTRVEKLFARKSGRDRTQLHIHKEIADIFIAEEYADRSKGLHHLKEAEAILKRIQKSEKDEDDLTELQAKILSLECL